MTLSLDTLLTAQASRSQDLSSRVSAGAPNAVGDDVSFSRQLDKTRQSKEFASNAAERSERSLEEYRKRADAAEQDVSRVRDDYGNREDFVEKEEFPYKTKESERSSAEPLQKSENVPDAQKLKSTAADVAENEVAAVVLDDTQALVSQTKSAQERGVKDILNAVTQGAVSENGTVLENPLATSAEEILSRGEQILESQSEVAGLVLNQVQGKALPVAAGEGAVRRNGAPGNAGVEQALVNADAAKPVQQGEVATQASKTPSDVARQSKELLKLAALPAQSAKQGAVSGATDNAQNASKTSADNVAAQASAVNDIKQAVVKSVQFGQQKTDAPVNQNAQLQQQANASAGGENSSSQNGSQQQANANAQAALYGNAASDKQSTPSGLKQAAFVDGLDAKALEGMGGKEVSVPKNEAAQLLDSPKFKEYLKAVEVHQKSHTNTQNTTRADDVMAQIKFGVASAAAKADKTVTIQLYPKELGTVDVHMKISASGRAEVQVVAEKADTASLLQREAQSLKDALNDALKNQDTQLNFAFREGGSGQNGTSQQSPFAGMQGNNNEIDSEHQFAKDAMVYEMNMTTKQGVNLVISGILGGFYVNNFKCNRSNDESDAKRAGA